MGGIEPWSHFMYLKYRGLLAPSSSGPRKRIVRPTSESGPGYPSWMGSPFGSGANGDDADAYLQGDVGIPSFGTIWGSEDHILATGVSHPVERGTGTLADRVPRASRTPSKRHASSPRAVDTPPEKRGDPVPTWLPRPFRIRPDFDPTVTS